MANLIIDIGSLSVKAAWAEGVELGKSYRYQGYRVAEFVSRITSEAKAETTVVASDTPVQGDLYSVLSENSKELILPQDFFCASIDFGEAFESLSPARKASLIAAAYYFPRQPVSVFDFGAMINIDLIDGHGKYLGGALSPGLRTRYKAVNRYSKNLPLLKTPDSFKEIGMSVEESIDAGINSGIIFEIEGYLRKYPENINIFTGGDANFFASKMKRPIFAICNLVLTGLALIACHYDFKGIA